VRVAWAGFRAAEVVLPAGEPLDDATLRSRLEAEDLALLAVDAGVAVAGSPEGAMEAVAHLGRCAVLAYRLGASRVVFSPPPEGEGRNDLLATAIARLVGVLREVPVTLSVRPLRGSVIPSSAALVEFCRAVDASVPGSQPRPSDRLALALDPAEVALMGCDPGEALEEILSPEAPIRLGHVYLTDYRGRARVAPGEGELDWGALSGALLAGGYEGAVTVLPGEADPLLAEVEAKEAAGFAQALFPDALFVPGEGR
jgi:sugar phosphate isomerase/epimerase